MAKEEYAAERDNRDYTVQVVESMIEVALNSWEMSGRRTGSVDWLGEAARESGGKAQELAIWGLSEIAKDSRDVVGDQALEQLDQIAKYAPDDSNAKRLAVRALPNALKR